MSHQFNERFDVYFNEYYDLLRKYPNTKNWEIEHRKKILKEWLENEVELWKAT